MNQRADPVRDAGIVIHSSVIRPGRRERVKALLRTREELCSIADLYGDALSNGRNDVSTLINRDGWVIEKFFTAHGNTGAHRHYRLLREGPVRARQLRTGVA